MIDSDKVSRAGELARSYFLGKRANCAEAVFQAVYELVGSPLPRGVVGLLTPLGGGVGIAGENCGAMLAGVIALSLVHGRDANEEALEEHRGGLWKVYSLYNQLPHRFRERFGSLTCRELTRRHVYGTKQCRRFCENVVAQTAVMTMELLAAAEEKGLAFPFRENLLSQAAERTGMSVEELVRLKAKGEPFPIL